MKANQAFRESDEAVSPVIGVILMVAITVVLAAVVFVLVSDLGGESNSPISMSTTTNEGGDRIEVVSAEGRADWSKIEVKASDATVKFNLNGGSNTTIGTFQSVASSTDKVEASDYLKFCTTTAAGVSNIEITLRDADANAVIKQITFASIAYDANC